MRKRFIVALDAGTKEQHEIFREHLKATTPGLWWHWISNLWLIVDPEGKLDATGLRETVSGIYPDVTNLVIELDSDGGDTWSGYGPKTAEKNMFTWIYKNWKR